MSKRLRTIDADELRAAVPMRSAMEQVQRALREGFDPEHDHHRTIETVRSGQLLLMPADFGRFTGQKLATVAPANPARGLPRIQALYVLIDAETLAPLAVIDGTELTSIRTPAISAAMVDLLAPPDAASLVVFGSGPQAIRHVEAMRLIRPIRDVVLVGRDRARAEAAAASVDPGVAVRIGAPSDVARADLIVCATTAREPLFDAALASDRATIVAVGSHEPTARELPSALLGRSQVVVESVRVALTEAGDVMLAIEDGALTENDLVTMRELATGAVAAETNRPNIVKTCGMGWQDLAVASLVGNSRS